MSLLDTPASIRSIPGLATALPNRGFQVIASSRANMSTNAGGIQAQGMMTTRQNIIPSVSCSWIVLAFGNYNIATSSGESPGINAVRLNASIEYNGVVAESGAQRIPVFFDGQREIVIGQHGLVYSDPIPVVVTAGVPFFIRTCVKGAGSAYVLPFGASLKGGTGPGSSNNGDGVIGSDQVDAGLTQVVVASSAYGPSVIMGFVSGGSKSVAIIGDSLGFGFLDGGYDSNDGGYLRRALNNQLSLNYQYPVTPLIPNSVFARGGETMASFAAALTAFKRTELATLHSTVIDNYGRNDFGQTLIQLQANRLIIANWFLTRGKTFIACTIPPSTTSTNGWIDTAGQTQTSAEAVRQGYNSWLRDPSSNGFVQQSAVPSRCAFFDAAAAVEINLAGALTLNGGYIQVAPNGGTPTFSGTVTSGSSASLINDASRSWTQDQQRGLVLRMLTGACANQQQCVIQNSPTQYKVGGFTTAPSAGDSYQLFQSYTVDGTHYSSLGYLTIAQSFPLSLVR